MSLRDVSTDIAYFGRITERHGPAIGLPEEITYSAVAINTHDQVVITEALPRRRVSQGAKIIAAEPRDLCLIGIDDTGLFLQVFEGIKFKQCEPVSPGDSTSGGLLSRFLGRNR